MVVFTYDGFSVEPLIYENLVPAYKDEEFILSGQKPDSFKRCSKQPNDITMYRERIYLKWIRQALENQTNVRMEFSY